ncbi:FAD/NAD(P)-binding protein, partial [Leucobacter chromiiresistens]
MSPSQRSDAAAVSVVCIGAGPAAIMMLERLAANHAHRDPEQRIDVRLVDPHRPGGGRIWRRDQSPLLKLNSMLEDVACFTDASSSIDGPVAPGPSLAEWVRAVRAGSIAAPDWADPALEKEIAEIGDRDFPTRRLNHAYLSWVFAETVRRASDRVAVEWVPDTAVAVEPAGPAPGLRDDAAERDGGAERGGGAKRGGGAERQIVRLASGGALAADIVILALGHNGTDPSDESVRLADFADEHGLEYVAPAFTADLDLDHLPAGSDAIVRGLGLAAIDLVVMLTGGRGGRFETRADGSLRYLPSGREPVLHLGSRRGVPYRSKVTSRVQGDPVGLAYLGASFREATAARTEPLDFVRDAWPLVAADLLTGYYRELFTGHPTRVSASWKRFEPRLRAVLARPGGFASPELAELVRAHVPDPDDRLDLAAFDRPLAFPPEGSEAGTVSASANAADAVQQRVLAHIAADLRLRSRPEHSATQALFMTGLYAFLALAEVPPERWNARSRTRDLPGRWFAYFSYLASGPPGHRLDELIALAEAGVVRFLGADVRVEADAERGVFTATGSAVVRGAGEGEPVAATAAVSARTLIDAWLPEARASRSDNPLLRQLVASGQLRELAVVDETGAEGTGLIEVGPGGRVPGSSLQFALGPFVAGLTGGAFTRPGIDALPFRVHDRVARAVLDAVTEVAAARTPASRP